MFQGLLGPLAAVPYDRWLRRHLHWKIPIGRIPGTPLMESVVGFMFGFPLLLMVALFAGLMLGYLALVEFIPPSWVPRGARTAVAWGVLALVALALMALAVWVFARWLARTALHDCLDDRDDAMSPQTRIMGVTLGATLLAALFPWVVAPMASSPARRVAPRVTPMMRVWGDIASARSSRQSCNAVRASHRAKTQTANAMRASATSARTPQATAVRAPRGTQEGGMNSTKAR